MHPIAFTLGKLTIRWYGVFCALGFITAVAVLQLKRKSANMNAGQVSDLVLFTMISGILGARLFYVVQFWDNYRNNLLEIVRIDHGGLVYYGGFLCALLTIYLYCRKNQLKFLNVIDISVPGLALGHAFGRVGCFLNGCCFGKPCPLPGWGLVFPPNSAPALRYPDPAPGLKALLNGAGSHPSFSLPLYPVQLYEMTGNLLLFGVLFYLTGRLKKPGQNAALYLVGYGLLRFADEFFRGDHENFFLEILTPAQSIGLLLVPLGLYAFFHLQKQPSPALEH